MRSISGISSPALFTTKSIGIVQCRMEYFCRTIPITHSTWILALAIVLVSSTSIRESWSFPFVNADMCKLACIIPTYSPMSNPRSANMTSPGNNLFRMPECLIRCCCWHGLPRFQTQKQQLLGLRFQAILRLCFCVYNFVVTWVRSSTECRANEALLPQL